MPKLAWNRKPSLVGDVDGVRIAYGFDPVGSNEAAARIHVAKAIAGHDFVPSHIGRAGTKRGQRSRPPDAVLRLDRQRGKGCRAAKPF